MAKSDPLVKSDGKGVPRKSRVPTPFRRYLLYGATFLGVTFLVFGAFTYVHYSNLIDEKLKDGPAAADAYKKFLELAPSDKQAGSIKKRLASVAKLSPGGN